MHTRRRSIRRQVLVFAGLICLTVFVIAGGVLFFHHLGQTRARLAESLRSIAHMTAANASGALAFNDFKAATDVLGSLRHDPLIVSAVLYDLQGRPFVTYGTAVDTAPETAPLNPDEALVVNVLHNKESYGRLLVRSDNHAELLRTAFTWITVYGIALVATVIIASLLATAFQKAVATPLAVLADTAAAVTKRNDYTARATPGGPREVADLAEAFNTMLAEIGRRDAELARQLTALDREMHEREAAEASLRQNTRELLRLSHEAGMAEVATGVLHNIGNALNSINVSAELLDDHLRARATASAGTLRTFFHALPPKAAPVFTAHPDGREVLAFATTLTDHAVHHLDVANQELLSLRTGVAHLKDIVVRQQALAKSVRHNEGFDVREAVSEALLLDKTAGHAGSPGLRVEQTHEGDTRVHSDRSAVVQILVNLFANARAALAGVPSPTLRIRVGPPNSGHVPVAVIDNGVGIAPDQLVSIFSYGFTTKAGGHGFGLHNAANTARLLGGALRVHSDGPHLGAVFTLELPRHQPAASAS